ncbi:caspase family protein [Bordetella sp. 02P26C-1]|uniref:caspase family protein n=1 Tax=Bordetella sp. 02P26C-1 TaxID=2683195 RepID=UPI001352DA59|nr:caspase family protein [Bordetella sp. 02P26C-1]MVW78367.1 hypothetical protein [Bordetella sp. 02P26C-1]
MQSRVTGRLGIFWRITVWVVLVLLGCYTRAGLAAGASSPGTAHALLVGVSDYPFLDPGAQLLGPRNDVALWRDYLTRSRPDVSLTVLADGVKDAGLPTRQAIMQELERIAGEARDGDFVFLMFAGHGAQQPASQASIRDEPDGLDEIFLPRDARGWDSARAVVENAIVDTEFKQAIDKIRAKKAFVWAVFDTCHSATMTRAVRPSAVRYRQVSAQQLGIPPDVMQAARARSVGSVADRSGQRSEGQPQPERAEPVGDLVAFYAAQSHQETPEFALPPGAPDAREHGVFSYTLLQVLEQAPNASYTELIERVMQRFQATAGATAVPMIEGTALSARVWGGQQNQATAWRVNRKGGHMTLSAGLMHDQTPGSTLKLYQTPGAQDEDVLATVVVSQARAVDADVKLLQTDGHAVEVNRLPEIMYARAWQTQVDWRLKVALQHGGNSGCEPATPALESALNKLRQQDALAKRVQWLTSESAGVDLWLCLRADRLELLDADATVDVPAPAIALQSSDADKVADTIADALLKASRVLSVLRVAQATGMGKALDVKAWVRRPQPGEPACDELTQPAPRQGSQAYEPGSQMELHEGDCLSLIVHNTSTSAVDLTIMLVHSGFGMTALWPDSPQMFNPRIEAGAKVAIGEYEALSDSLGRERLLVLGLPVVQPSQPISLAFLAQDNLDTSVRTRGQQDPFTALMMDAGFGNVATRSLRPARQGGQPMSAQVFSFRVQPR